MEAKEGKEEEGKAVMELRASAQGSDVDSEGCRACDGTGCPCMRWRDWQSMEYGCECGCAECGLKPV
jgi:hypothetical protein